MAVLNRAAEMQQEVAEWRRHLHQNPELMFDVHETAAFVEAKLREFGCDEVVTGLGRTGVCAVIKGNRGDGETLGLRSDMDALPIIEATGKPYASKTQGKMHACGHDGHTAMLLGAAQYLSETRNFAGSIVVIFQPAEEGGGGGNEMVKDGMMERFGIDRVYGMHNMPNVPVGEFTIRKGGFFAATDEFNITLKGKGGHAAMPHSTIDPIVAGAALIQSLQSIASRNVDPLEAIVVSVTKFHAGDAHNVIPNESKLGGTIRTLDGDIREYGEKRLREITQSVADAYGCEVQLEFRRGYPVTVNHDIETEIATQAASAVVGAGNIDINTPPLMGGEDFSYMLEARPGAMILIGNGESAGLHHPKYDFNDEIIPYGISYWAQIAEQNPAR
ncbi:M20 aminoacylase family protein [Ahrensia marina]|uniref:Amidohydrolase n=1 Tax=Ahrensia marina TaxID=1514904 RepID=A0A0M9GLY2_9HYPH|nr:M20 aminoacylase family protein [Ahrensia marina]KPB00853.1 amidohydrolase [Ahrensia marina]